VSCSRVFYFSYCYLLQAQSCCNLDAIDLFKLAIFA